MTDRTCPVCEGKGWVPVRGDVSGGADAVKCHGCGGSGKVNPEEARREGAGETDDPRELAD